MLQLAWRMRVGGSETRRSPIMRVHWFLLDIFYFSLQAIQLSLQETSAKGSRSSSSVRWDLIVQIVPVHISQFLTCWFPSHLVGCTPWPNLKTCFVFAAVVVGLPCILQRCCMARFPLRLPQHQLTCRHRWAYWLIDWKCNLLIDIGWL